MNLNELKNSRMLKAALKEATTKDIDEIITKLNNLREKMKEVISQNEQRRKDNDAYMSDVLKELRKRGIGKDEMQRKLDGKSGRNPTQAKYRYTDVYGNVLEWSGQGRKPKKLLEVMERDGTSLENYLIEK